MNSTYRKTGQLISKDNLDVIRALEMNGLIQSNPNGDFGENYSISHEKMDEAISFIRDYFMVLGKK